jgi:indolepyruvate ferredoxin oxidoreductase alpha subunit
MFVLRTVTRISHAHSDVKLGEIRKDKPQGSFERDVQYTCIPEYSRKNRTMMLDRFQKIKRATDDMPWNELSLVKGAKLGIIACGISYAYAVEALRWMGLEGKVSVLKIGTPHPLPEKLVKRLLKSVELALVVEEVEPFVENHVRIIANRAAIATPIHGKDVVPIQFELSVRKVCEAMSKVVGVATPVDFTAIDEALKESGSLTLSRPPTLCTGCPHRASYYAINQAMRKVRRDLGEHIYTGDIGCYSLGIYPPLNGCDIATCMGSGFGLANGVARASKRPVLGTLGDSTFFHSGMSAMVNAVFNNTSITMVVLDNSATAMTGFQPHPGTGATAMGEQTTKIAPEDIARTCKVPFVAVIDPFEVRHSIEVLEDAIRFEGPALVVMRRSCEILAARERRKTGEKIQPYYVDENVCTECNLCIDALGCRAIGIDGGAVMIDETECAGCGVCAQICPVGAIKQDAGK